MQGRVLMIGLGLIGGSLALSIKKAHKQAFIVGYDVNEEQGRLAKMLAVVDEITASVEEEAVKADLILIAAPVIETERILTHLLRLPLQENVIISDAGSTKQEIVRIGAKFKEKNITFIGGHPMAGSHKSGVCAARPLLFENAFYLLTPEEHIEENKIHHLQIWLSGTNARFLIVSPKEHDQLTGIISHFPHIIAASLVHQAKRSGEVHELVPRLAAGGFRDITRIASSNPNMWRDILIHNKSVLLELLDDWQLEMEKVKNMLISASGSEIHHYFSDAKHYRDDLPQKQKGAIPAFYDLFVDVPDYPGVISEITGYLAKEDISITNISIRETREDIMGVLVISFQTDEDRNRAISCIEHHTNYDTTIGL
ncbi:prephenate dehydrogenase [Cytobacillus gottheilii]|uniref:prephenate dehydrogenase n=1 Tax=Cytobacillus gottheilii TaxID=859144 RepID=UPI0009BC58B5|nr:prephenate dehydrogenase [Cytobacillus gottheilii]